MILRALILAVGLAALMTSAGAAAPCAGGVTLAGFCIPYDVMIDPMTGLPLGSPASPLNVVSVPSATAQGGLSTFRVSNAAGAAGATVKVGSGRVYAFDLCNTAAATRYLRFYDSPAPVPGTTPVFAGAIAISAGSCQQFSTNVGLSMTTGIGIGITAANGDNDTTAVSAGDVTGFVGFQ